MPGILVQELFSGGLVTKRHPTLLSESELQQTDDCVYRSFDPAIHVAPGRTIYNDVALGEEPEDIHVAPDSDDTLGTWTPSTGIELYEMLNESVPSDVDFITTTGLNDTCILGLTPTADPGFNTGHTLKVRARVQVEPSGLTVPFLEFRLRQGTTNIVLYTLISELTDTFQTFSIPVSEAQAATITDYNNLNVYINYDEGSIGFQTGDGTLLGGATFIPEISWLELEIVDSSPAGGPIKGLSHLTFDGNITDQLIVLTGGNLYTSNFTALTGAFALVTGAGFVDDAVTTNGDATVTSASGAFATMIKGAVVMGPGIPPGTRVLSVTGPGSIELTNNATASGTVTLIFLLGMPIVVSDEDDTTLDIVQWSSVYFALTGGQVKRLSWQKRTPVDSDSLDDVFFGRTAGMVPVGVFGRGLNLGDTSGPDIVAGTWNADLGTGTYWFVVTEVINPGEIDEVESTYTAGLSNQDKKSKIEPRPATITDVATQGIRITFPPITNTAVTGNNQATHWYVYMSDKTVNATVAPSLAAFKRVAEVPVTSASITLGGVAVQSGPNLASTTAAGPNLAFEFNNPGFMLIGGDNNRATSTSGTGLDPPGENTLLDFNLGGVTGTISGVQINVFGEAAVGFGFSGRADYYVYIKSGSKTSPTFFGQFNGQFFQAHQYGGSSDTMGVTWVDTDFDDANLTIVIGKLGSGSERQRVRIDAIQVAVWTGGSAIPINGRPFQVVTYRDQIGTTVSDPANFPPPPATTGDVFQGQVVLNDPGDDKSIVYSLPNQPEYYPKPYRMGFQGKKKDKVTFIRRVQQVLIVGLRDSVKRVNYLPTEIDTDPRPGIAHEDLTLDHGIPGPMAGTIVDLGTGPVLAYASINGLHLTDGVDTKFLNVDLDWENTVDVSKLSSSILRAHPSENWLMFFYCPPGVEHTQNTRCLVFVYSPDHLKAGGTLKAVGPVKVSARAAAEVILNGKTYVFTGHDTDGVVYIEDQGLALPPGYTAANEDGDQEEFDIIPIAKTRCIYPSGIGHQARESRIYVMTDPDGASQTIASTIVLDSAAVISVAPADFSGLAPGMLVTGPGIDPDTVIIEVTDDDNIVLSKVATVDGDVDLIFSSGTLSLTISGQDIGSAKEDLETNYQSTEVGGLFVCHADNLKECFELTLSRVRLPDDSLVPLVVGMRLHYFAYMMTEKGQETNRQV